jgi:hypothetical protein
MPYAPTDWVNGSTPLNEANMDKIELGIRDAQATGETAQTAANNARAVADAAQLAASAAQATANSMQPLSGKYQANGYPGLDADTNLALQSGQKIVWATDTRLYRHASGPTLMTDGSFYVKDGLATGYGSPNLITLSSDGHLYFGSSFDTHIYREAGNALRTPGYMNALAYRVVDGGSEFRREGVFGARVSLNCDFSSRGVACRAGQDGAELGNKYTINWDGAAHLYIDNTYVGRFAFATELAELNQALQARVEVLEGRLNALSE